MSEKQVFRLDRVILDFIRNQFELLFIALGSDKKLSEMSKLRKADDTVVVQETKKKKKKKQMTQWWYREMPLFC